MLRETLLIMMVMVFIGFSGCVNESSSNPVTIMGKHLGFQHITDAIYAATDGDTILVDSGTYHERFRVNKSITLKGENRDTTIIDGGGEGVVVYVTANMVNITGFTITNSGNSSFQAGIRIDSDHNRVVGNNIVGNNGNGVYLYGAHWNNISDNNISGNKARGVFIYSSSNNIVSYNQITWNDQGVYGSYATNNTVSFNTISQSKVHGFHFTAVSDSNVFTDNVISYNDYGVWIKGSRYNTVVSNLFTSNQKGLYFCCGGKNNTVYRNVFMNNVEWNAKGYPVNQWDNGSVGNYWDDYNGTDADGDGIGDTPYVIQDNNVDRYPLMKP
ncbi:MAG TPA: hypothetical protein ENI42_06110 [Thermoplasmatales archaeon]|nr:hypothetical protein [Thermoplasmatales archaeon]